MFGTFGNKVRIKNSPETEAKGLAGKEGEIFGETVPSLMDLEIIGTPQQDYAVNVYFEDTKESFWFDTDLIEQLNDGQGSEITLDGIDKKLIKGSNGEWIEEELPAQQQEKKKDSRYTENQEETNRKWWRFWKKRKEN